jgi:hypothetical protein
LEPPRAGSDLLVPVVSGMSRNRRGYPDQRRGVTTEPGLYFIGLHGMHTIGSGLFSGVGADAEHVVTHISDLAE